MTEFTPVSALLGGVLIGVAATLLLKFNGRVAGVSGIANGLFSIQPGERLWRGLFLVGLVVGGYIYQATLNQPLLTREGFSMIQLVAAGLLVGFGTRLGSGCTSGHGVAGIARLSPRSILATFTFLGAGALTASIIFIVFGNDV